MMSAVEALTKKFPGLDCGSCGAPTCQTLAEDIVRGAATANDCIYVLRRFPVFPGRSSFFPKHPICPVTMMMTTRAALGVHPYAHGGARCIRRAERHKNKREEYRMELQTVFELPDVRC